MTSTLWLNQFYIVKYEDTNRIFDDSFPIKCNTWPHASFDFVIISDVDKQWPHCWDNLPSNCFDSDFKIRSRYLYAEIFFYFFSVKVRLVLNSQLY